jgi:TolA-binding protein
MTDDTDEQVNGEFRDAIAAVRDGFTDPPEADVPSYVAVQRRAWKMRQARSRTRFRVGMAAACVAIAVAMVAFPRHEQTPAVGNTATEQAAATAELRALQDRLAQLEQEIRDLRTELAAQQTPIKPVVTSDMQQEAAAAIVMEAGLNMEERFGDTAAAVSRYRDVLRYFPDTSAATRARARIEAVGESTT